MRFSIGLAAVLQAAISMSVLAQTMTQASPVKPDDESAKLNEIVVTANKMEQSELSYGGSISVLGGEALESQGRQRIDSVLQGVAGVEVQTLSTGFAVAIRGVSVETPAGIGDPGTALNFDGVYTDRPEAGRIGFFDINRVEVLRGPQGTLYGRNAEGGVVNVLTNNPIGEFEAAVSGDVGNYAERQFSGMLNVPLTDDVAARGAINYVRHDGYLSNGQDDADDLGARLKVLFNPLSNLTLLVGGEYGHVTGNGPGSTAAFTSGEGAKFWDTPSPGGNHFEFDTYKAFGTATVDLGAVDLVIEPSYQRFSSDTLTNLGTFNILYDITEEQTALETRLAGKRGNGPVDWTAGLYTYDGKIDGLTTEPSFESQLSHTRSYAGFADLTYHLSGSLRATAGIRYTEDRKNITIAELLGAGVTSSSLDATFVRTDYKAGLEYDITPDSMAYATVSTGFRSGGLWGAQPGQEFHPETLTSYEIGNHNRFLEGRFGLNADVFYYDYKDYQATNVVFVNGVPLNAVFNAPGVKTSGAEIESEVALTSIDRIRLSTAYLHARFDNGFALDGVDYSGLPPGHSPEWDVTASYEHTFDLGRSGLIRAHADSNLQSSSYVTFVENSFTLQHTYTRSNADLTYESSSGRFTLTAFIRNIEDVPVKAQYLNVPPSPQMAIQQPRTFGLRAAVTFK
jgi:iron complex outermembrane receptor protein